MCGCNNSKVVPTVLTTLEVAFTDIKYTVMVEKPITFKSVIHGHMIVNKQATLYERDVVELVNSQTIPLKAVVEANLLTARHPELVSVSVA